MSTQPNLMLLPSPDWKDYALLDSGDGLKLERFGRYVFVRPESQAMWKRALTENEWKNPKKAPFRVSPTGMHQWLRATGGGPGCGPPGFERWSGWER